MAESNVVSISRDRVAATARRTAPWAIAAAILWFLFDRVPIADAWIATREARLLEFALVTAVAVTAWWLIESGTLAYLFTRFNARLTWADARSLRALTYLVTPINWNLGTAAIILHLRRSKGIDAMESTSTMLFYGLIDLMVLAMLALVGASTLPASPAIASVQHGAAIAAGFAFGLLVLLMTSRPRWGWLMRFRGAGINSTHRKATVRDVAIVAGVRTCYFGLFVVYYWLGTHAFNAPIPLLLALAATPIILVVASLPITPAGLGTQQAAMLYFFGPYGSEAAILAFALSFPVAFIFTRLPLGLLFIRDLAALRESQRAA